MCVFKVHVYVYMLCVRARAQGYVHVHRGTCVRVWGYSGPISHRQMEGSAVVLTEPGEADGHRRSIHRRSIHRTGCVGYVDACDPRGAIH